MTQLQPFLPELFAAPEAVPQPAPLPILAQSLTATPSPPRLVDAARNDSITPLIHYPDVPGPVRSAHAKRLGRAGERLVDSYLERWGFDCCEAPECQPFDRYLMLPERSLRLQIKTTTLPEGSCYRFNMQMGYRPSPQGRRHYDTGSYDLAALVVLPANAVAFTADQRTCHRIPIAELTRFAEDPQRSLLEALEAILGPDASFEQG